jgi:Protein phosphatase 2C
MWQLREWWLPKAGNAPEEYEDAFQSAPARGRFAVADGATETSFSGRWAAALVAAFAAAPPDFAAEYDSAPPAEALAAWLAPLQQAWRAAVPWDRLPWYALEKAQAGAFASLLGIELFPRRGTRAAGRSGAHWQASAVGDSVLFHLRGDALLTAWPIASSSELGSRPRLLSSLPGRNRLALAEWACVTGEAEPGDRFLLVTDALAHWALSAVEAGEPTWATLWEIADAESFAALVARERDQHRLRNDDVTLVAFAVPAEWELAVQPSPAAEPEEAAGPELPGVSEIHALVPVPKALPEKGSP